jgi:hypothetical protein
VELEALDASTIADGDWTIIVMTDHGHMSPPTIGGIVHEFQIPVVPFDFPGLLP